jgi:hypothetical protein
LYMGLDGTGVPMPPVSWLAAAASSLTVPLSPVKSSW